MDLFSSRNGPFPLHYWQSHLIEPYLNICLAGLKDNDRTIANGEILGISLLMEDLLIATGSLPAELQQQTDQQQQSENRFNAESTTALFDATQPNQTSSTPLKTQPSNSVSNAAPFGGVSTASGFDSVSVIGGGQTTKKPRLNPILSHKKWHDFLITWKRLELLKLDWGRKKLGVESINNGDLFAKFS